jgi:DNA-directed RNA polymerase specialized sigma24 family protein
VTGLWRVFARHGLPWRFGGPRRGDVKRGICAEERRPIWVPRLTERKENVLVKGNANSSLIKGVLKPYEDLESRMKGGHMKSFAESAPGKRGLARGEGCAAATQVQSAGTFPETQWTALLKPLKNRLASETDTLDRLFRIYRPAIVAFIRARVRDPGDAEDLAHDYIHRLLQSEELAGMDRSKGRFRSFLIVSIKHFLCNHYAARSALKRGGGAVHVPVEDYIEDLAEDPKDEDIFMAEWVAAIHQEVVRCLRVEWEKAGKGDEFDDYEPFLWGKEGNDSREALSRRHRLTVNAINVRISRLRDRYKVVLREVVSQTVRENEVDEEIRNLTSRILGTGVASSPDARR